MNVVAIRKSLVAAVYHESGLKLDVMLVCPWHVLLSVVLTKFTTIALLNVVLESNREFVERLVRGATA